MDEDDEDDAELDSDSDRFNDEDDSSSDSLTRRDGQMPLKLTSRWQRSHEQDQCSGKRKRLSDDDEECSDDTGIYTPSPPPSSPAAKRQRTKQSISSIQHKEEFKSFLMLVEVAISELDKQNTL